MITLAVAVVLVGGAVAAFLVLGKGGNDDDGSNGGGSGTPTVDTRRSIPAGQVDFNLTVQSNSCTFGLQPGAMHLLSFVFTPAGGGDLLHEGDSVNVTGIRSDGGRVPLGKTTFQLADFQFTYPVEAGNATGTGKVVTSFTETGDITSAQLTETYTVGGQPCQIVASR